MSSPKLLHTLAWLPLLIFGLLAIIFGFFGLVLPEPWLLDKAINEAVLHTTFGELFRHETNRFLPQFLTIVYRFCGLWLLVLGAMICAYVMITLMGTRRARNTILAVLGILMASLFYLEYTLIPGSPFVILTWALLILYLISLWASFKLTRANSEPRA